MARMPVKPLNPANARLRLSAAALPFRTTSDIKHRTDVVGQERALAALELGLKVDNPRFHIFVTGATGTGRTSVVPRVARRFAKLKPAPNDWVYLHNFVNADQPVAIPLPPGQGRVFAKEMSRMVEWLDKRIPEVLSSRSFRSKQQEFLERALDDRRAHFDRLESAARTLGIGVEDTAQNIQLVPLHDDGRPMEPEIYDALAESEKRHIEDRERKLRDDILGFLDNTRRIQDATEAGIEALERKLVSALLAPRIARIRRKMEANRDIDTFLAAVLNSVVDGLGNWVADDDAPPESRMERRQRALDARARYLVNVVSDHAGAKHGPLLFERHPTFGNLLGRIERRVNFGAVETDHTLIRGGSLLAASGGILIAEAREVATSPHVWPALKRALREQLCVIEDPDDSQPGFAAASIRPQPIPIRIKMILIGSMEEYHLLRELDEDFGKLFKIRADFEDTTELSDRRMQEVAAYMAQAVKTNGLLPVAASGVVAALQWSARLAGRQDLLSLELGALGDLLVESDVYARSRNAKTIDRRDIAESEAARRERDGMFRDSMMREFARKRLIVALSGSRVGQVNGLAVVSLGDLGFGFPSRITARTFVGSSGLVNIERESDLSGEIHSKAVLILSGYLGGMYARTQPLALSASVTFEQSYALVEGDSASLAELIALLSSVTNLPVRQDIAITGSMSQFGEVQPIGSVNEKIEGFFDVCSQGGLTGTQGVAIPAQNVDELLLREDICAAMRAKKFFVWPLTTVDEALELLLDTPAGQPDDKGRFPRESVHGRVMERLAEMAAAAEDGGKPRTRAAQPRGERKL